MKKYVVLVAALAALASCGNDDSGAPDAAATEPTASAPDTSAASAVANPVAVKAVDTGLGKILAGANGMTLYAFTNDRHGRSTCEGVCAEQWPPAVVPEGWTIGPELDAGVFATYNRSDGTTQLVAGKYPLYYYAGDAAPGDTTGQGSGNVWFVVDTAAGLVRDANAKSDQGSTNAGDTQAAGTASVKVAETSAGTVLVDADGMSLYAFTKDADGSPTCADACANAWPAAVVDGAVSSGPGLDGKLVSVVPAIGGGQQLKAGKWPLYRYAGDAAPGDVNGQGSGGEWFLVGTDGSLIK
jgi:predicted lipoprotein with Yx(FWY)xxD motif